VVERIEDMPAGTVGFRASGKLTRDDYRQVMEPGLRAAADAGEIRMLFALDSFDGLEPGAWFEDMKTGLGLGVGHHSAWKRSAIVTDVEWLAKAFQFFSWMTPGEVEVFEADRLEDARRWVTG
jgi:SpoIIAA-like